MKNDFIKKIEKTIIDQALEKDFTALDAELEFLGYDIGEINNFSEKMYKKQSFLLKGKMNIKKDANLLEKASMFLQKAIEDRVDKPISYLKSLIQKNELKVQYRNLESLSMDEIKEIIKDQDLLELLEKLENEDQ